VPLDEVADAEGGDEDTISVPFVPFTTPKLSVGWLVLLPL
jgi:hypothetical protein